MGPRVLLAEDEPLIARSFADLLEAEGYEVALASDGAEALDAARRLGDALDALVTDLRMPRLCGEDLIRALPAERPGLPVVVVTGSAPRGGEEALRRGAGGDGPVLLLHTLALWWAAAGELLNGFDAALWLLCFFAIEGNILRYESVEPALHG